jgi:hypothetical protein
MPITGATPFDQYDLVRQLDRIEKKLNKLLSKTKPKKAGK